MNHELRCYLRLRVNIPTEILSLIEKYLWQLKLARTNLILFSSQSGLFYLHHDQYKLGSKERGGTNSMYFYRTTGKSIDSKPHYYGPDCMYNKPLGLGHNHPRTYPDTLYIHHGQLIWRWDY